MGWKPALYEYVKAANAREMDYSAGRTAEEQLRLKRLKAWHRERNVRPIGCDTALSVRRVRETDRGAIVDIHLRKILYMKTNGVEHTEERIDGERVILERSPAGEWRVIRSEPVAAERAAVQAALGAASGMGAGGIRSVPLLDERKIARPHSLLELRAASYDREAARAYADRYWNEANPEFLAFDVDCTNYVSQCLYAGGAPMDYTGIRESGWWYRGRSGNRELWSFSWSVAHALNWYLSARRSEGLRAEVVHSPQELTVGDVICYDFDGDGRFDHTTIVTGADGAGMPLVNAHTSNSRNRYWDYKDSYAWTERTKYRFFRISDLF